ncbi:hypothetical protein JSY36_17605 [Bacillus sp. H-16]|uniref:hypothetical protein n=1 Tax=Alteribacter salitolerans TaxID=2912333 RepID=UPI0019627D47|nr:hypothetical protein [Alteribacter salitolerans]MBM7097553.1 hypothetical protein [Alteribacter salitolerans]
MSSVISSNEKQKRILDFVNKLPNETLREFEVRVTSFATESEAGIIDTIDSLMEQDFLSDKQKFALFTIKANFYRRYKDHTYFLAYVKDFMGEYNHNPFYQHLLSMAYKAQTMNADYFREGIRYANMAAKSKMGRDHVGILHNFSEAVVIAMEENLDDLPKKVIAEAFDDIKRVVEIDKDQYPKFFCTLGRWYAIYKKQYIEAKKLIEKAIDLEPSSGRNYALRIGDYQRSLLRIELLEAKELLNKKVNETSEIVKEAKDEIKEAKSDLKGMKEDNLKILGFFTAILSVIIGSLQIISGQDFFEAALLIVVLCASLTIVSACFSITFLKNTVFYTLILGGLTCIILSFLYYSIL